MCCNLLERQREIEREKQRSGQEKQMQPQQQHEVNSELCAIMWLQHFI